TIPPTRPVPSRFGAPVPEDAPPWTGAGSARPGATVPPGGPRKDRATARNIGRAVRGETASPPPTQAIARARPPANPAPAGGRESAERSGRRLPRRREG